MDRIFRKSRGGKYVKKDIENEKDESIKTTKKAIKQAKDTLEQISKDKHEQELAR